MTDFIYIIENHDWNYEKKNKFGYVFGNVDNLVNRINDAIEQHSERSLYVRIYQIKKTSNYKLQYKEIDKIFSIIVPNNLKIKDLEDRYSNKFPLLYKIQSYIVKSKTKLTNEFIYKNGLDLLDKIIKEYFPIIGLNLIKIFSSTEINSINQQSKLRYQQCINIKKHICLKSIWHPRNYQQIAKTYILEVLRQFFRIYLELATGGGKSFIIYSVLSVLKPDTIIIFSPRKIINEQNSSDKYLSILDNQYLAYNCSKNESFRTFKKKCQNEKKKMIIVACPQMGYKKVYEIIKTHKLTNIFIWFDEAHHTVENWINKLDIKQIKYFMKDNNQIKYRIFTSASPDKNQVTRYREIFGELYSPIKVKQLIDLKWLCPIVPYIFRLKLDDISINKYNLTHFNKYECTYGFSFHKWCPNAFNLFCQHYKSYINKHTHIKPFLLIGSKFKHELFEYIHLEYNYRCEQEFKNHPHSIAYIVQQYSMGYDFKKIDYIIFSDHKTSYKDIIQCIGRGTRPDNLDENGTNLDKKLKIMLPVYIDKDSETKFERIANVLRYLIYDINLKFDDINIKKTEPKKCSCDKGICNNNCICEGNCSQHCNCLCDKTHTHNNKYDGELDMKAMMLDLLKDGKYSQWKYKDFISLLMRQNIHNKKDYNKYLEERPELNLPNVPYKCFKHFTWEQTYKISPYYSKEECIKKIKDIKKKIRFNKIKKKTKYLHNVDNKIPDCCLYRFYGGINNDEFY